jgi:hypothetical protein
MRCFKDSFYLSTISIWNTLPQSIVSADSLETLKAGIDTYSNEKVVCFILFSPSPPPHGFWPFKDTRNVRYLSIFLKLFFIQNHRTHRYSLRKNQTVLLEFWKRWRMMKNLGVNIYKIYKNWAKNIYFIGCSCLGNSTALYDEILEFSTLDTCI